MIMEGEILDDLMLAHHVLEEAAQYDLESEVFVWALKAMKEDPSLTIDEAILKGKEEWLN